LAVEAVLEARKEEVSPHEDYFFFESTLVSHKYRGSFVAFTISKRTTDTMGGHRIMIMGIQI
jgi:hypothetical protein